MKAENAVILAAGASSRFAPLSYERHKALTEVKGEVLIERQIRQLREAGIREIFVVTGYKAEQFAYLKDAFGVQLIHNGEYNTRNNNSSIRSAKDVIRNTFVCSSDNYFSLNPFTEEPEDAYYAAVYADGPTEEWCLTEDGEGYINSVTVGGRDAWYMLGHTFWSAGFSAEFLRILEAEYDRPETAGKLWETIYMAHLDTLKMKIRRYAPGVIHEFDTMDELRAFDPSYAEDTRSEILKRIAAGLGARERDITGIRAVKGPAAEAVGFTFSCGGSRYRYLYASGELTQAGDGDR